MVYLAKKGADGIIDISPFTCMNGIVCEAIYPRLSRDLGGIPIRNFYFDGTQSDLDRDLGVYMELARSYQEAGGGKRSPARRLVLLEELVEGVARVVGVARRRGAGVSGGGAGAGAEAGSAIARHRDARRKQGALVRLVLHRNAHRDGLQALEAVDGSKCEHCLQQCSSALHFGQLPVKSVPGGSVVEQLKQREAATCCTRRGSRGPVTSKGGRGPCGLGPSRKALLFAVRVHVPVLSVLAIAVHGELLRSCVGTKRTFPN